MSDGRLTITAPSSLIARLSWLAQRNDRSVSAEARVAFTEYIARHDGDPNPGHSRKVDIEEN